jgi:hypothetical protein
MEMGKEDKVQNAYRGRKVVIDAYYACEYVAVQSLQQGTARGERGVHLDALKLILSLREHTTARYATDAS